MTAIGPHLQRVWDGRAAGNFIGGGTGSGLLVAAAAGSVWGPDIHDALLLGLLSIAGGLLLVWLEIGKPLRFLNVYRQPRRSWMAREAYAALPVFACGLAASWWRDPATAVVTAAFGMLFLFCQARILLASKGIPAWRERTLLPLVVFTGLAEGMGAFVALGGVTAPAADWPAVTLIALLVLRSVLWSTYRRRLAMAAPQGTVAVLDRLHGPFLALGNGLPVVLLVVAFLVPEWRAALVIVAGLTSLGAGWALKFVVVRRAAFTQGFALPRFPVRGAGKAPVTAARPGWR
jgi:phenylacetyl-CoA:acceptor oxidoreductase subunit 2